MAVAVRSSKYTSTRYRLLAAGANVIPVTAVLVARVVEKSEARITRVQGSLPPEGVTQPVA